MEEKAKYMQKYMQAMYMYSLYMQKSRDDSDTLGAGLEHKEGSDKLAEEAQEWG